MPTKSHHTEIRCPVCKSEISVTEPFKIEIREHPDLDSQEHCIVINDCDLIVARYGLKFSPNRRADRRVQWLMIVEVKTRHDPPKKPNDPDRSQQQLLWVVGHVMRNIKEPKKLRDKLGQWLVGHVQNHRLAYVDMTQWGGDKNTMVAVYGTHLLQFDGYTINTSDRVWWDGRLITSEQAYELLAFTRNPSTLKPLDIKRMHKQLCAEPPPSLFDKVDDRVNLDD